VTILRRLFSNQTFRLSLLAGFIYLIIAIIITYPLITQLSTHIPGVDEDSATHVWYLWWFKWALIEGHSPLFKTDWIYHPQVIDRIFDVHTFVNAAISLPFQYLTNVIFASNLVFYLNFFLTGMGTFLLAKRVTGSHFASFISGLIVVFMPYTWGQMLDNHTNLYTIWFIPFYLLFLLKTLEEKSWKNPILAGLLFGLQALNDLTLTTFMITATAIITLYYFVFAHRLFFTKTIRHLTSWTKPLFLRLIVLGGVFLIVFLPFLVPLLQAIQEGNDPGVPLSVQQVWSAQPWNFFNPSGNNPFLVQFSKISNVNAIEGSIYLGIIATLFALIGLYYHLFKTRKNAKNIGLWLSLTLSFIVLSLGPCATYLGVNTNLPFCSGLPLPFVFFHQLPLIGGIQEPIRMHIYTMIFVSLLAGWGFKAVLERINHPFALLLIIVSSGLILLEYYTPLPTTDLATPTTYQTISEDPGDFSVLSLPVGWNNQSYNSGFSPMGSLQFFQSIHEKKSFRATVARIPTQRIHFYLDKPLFKYLVQPDIRIPDSEDQNQNLAKKTFQDFHIKYIVLHKDYYLAKKKSMGQSQELIEKVLNAEKIHEDSETATYKLTF
jgi:hypothetical protein